MRDRGGEAAIPKSYDQALAAGPLLVASQTRDPLLVSMALLSEYLPTLLFGLIGGWCQVVYNVNQVSLR